MDYQLGNSMVEIIVTRASAPDCAASLRRACRAYYVRWVLFSEGRADQDEALKVTGPGEPLPAWLLEDWPGLEMQARIDALHRQTASAVV